MSTRCSSTPEQHLPLILRQVCSSLLPQGKGATGDRTSGKACPESHTTFGHTAFLFPYTEESKQDNFDGFECDIIKQGMVFRGLDPRSTLSQTRSEAGTETAAPGTAGQEICILAYLSWKGLQGIARAVTAQAAHHSSNLPSRAERAAHATTGSPRVEISISFSHHSAQQVSSFRFFSILISHSAQEAGRPPRICSCLSMQKADREDFAIRTSSPQGKIRGVQGKDKLFLLFKPKMDPLCPKTTAEDPVKQTLTSQSAPKWCCPRSAWSGMGTSVCDCHSKHRGHSAAPGLSLQTH